MSAAPFRRKLDLDARQYEELLAHADARTLVEAEHEHRMHARLAYALTDIPLAIEHPNGGRSCFLVYGRNISRGGLGVLHGGYLHPGSRCRVALRRAAGGALIVSGVVRFCRFVSGRCHEVGIEFKEEVDLDDLTRPEPVARPGAPAPEATPYRPVIRGSILVAESFEPDRRLLEHLLAAMGVSVRSAATPGAAFDAIRRGEVDAVVTGLSAAGDDSAWKIERMRRIGFRAPILSLTADSDPEVVAAGRKAGADDVISKPCNLDLLVAQLEARLGGAGGRPPQSFYSTAANVPGMAPLINEYVDLVHRASDQIERTFEKGLWDELHELCCQLKGSGVGYGFQALTVAAIDALRALEADSRSAASRQKVVRLVAICRALRAAG